MKATEEFHSSLVLSEWDKLLSLLGTQPDIVSIDGKTLELSEVVAVARYVIQVKTLCGSSEIDVNVLLYECFPPLGLKLISHAIRYLAPVSLSDNTFGPVNESADFLKRCLARGDCIYGMRMFFKSWFPLMASGFADEG